MRTEEEKVFQAPIVVVFGSEEYNIKLLVILILGNGELR